MKVATYWISDIKIHVAGKDEMIDQLDIYHNFHADTDDKGNLDYYLEKIILMNGAACFEPEKHKLAKIYNRRLKRSHCYISMDTFFAASICVRPELAQEIFGLSDEEAADLIADCRRTFAEYL